MGSENKSSTIKALLEKAKNIQNQNIYKSINDMELNKYYEIKIAKCWKNRFNKIVLQLPLKMIMNFMI